MSGPNFNITDKPAFAAQNVVYFTKASDLPAPSGGVITLDPNTTYVLYNDNPSASQKQVTLSDRIAIPDAGGVRITSTGVATVLLVYTGTGNFFTTSPTFTGFLHIDEIFIACPNGTAFDIDGVLSVGQEFFPRIFLSNTGFFDTDTIGTIKNISVNMNVGAFFDCKQGLILDHVEEALFGDWRFVDWKNDVGAIMLTVKNNLRFPKFSGCTFETGTNETAFNILPSIGDETFVIAGNSYRGTGTLYATGTTGPIASIADASSTGNTVNSAAGTAFGETIFTTAVAHGLSVGQEITNTGFSDANYNGTFEVLEVVTSTSFRVHTLFTATGTGSWATDMVQITDVAHGLSNGDGVQITDTTPANNYDGGARIFNVAADTFEINRVFNGTDTGNWDTDSLTQTDPRMRVVGNAGIVDSLTLAVGTANANATLTAITDGTYTNITLTGFASDPVTERFTLTGASTGTWTYDDPSPFSGILAAAISGLKTGSTENYRFTISINGAAPVFATAAFIPMEVKTSKVQVTLALPVSLVQTDTVQVMIAGDGTGDDITITDISMLIR